MPQFVGRLRTPQLPSAPSSPVKGEMYMDTTTNVLYWWNGTAWVSASGGGGSTDLTYEGAWAAGTAYTDGDVVVHNGISYMAVRPTTGVQPTPWPSANVPFVLPLGNAATPPVNPVEGQLWVYSAGVGVWWMFRYNAGSVSAYKWEFVGGAPKFSGVDLDEALVLDANWHNFPTGVSVFPDRPGEYDIEGMARVYTSTSIRVELGVGIGGSVPVAGRNWPDDGRIDARTLYVRERLVSSLGSSFTLQYRFTPAPGAAYGSTKRIAITPVRVS